MGTFERTKNFERRKVWTYAFSLLEGLEVDNFRLGRSGHINFWFGTSTWAGDFNITLPQNRAKDYNKSKHWSGAIFKTIVWDEEYYVEKRF